MKIYKDDLMEHYKSPRNYEIIENPDFTAESLNLSCGDKVIMQAIIEDDIFKRIAFQGEGCIISQAAASVLTVYCTGKSVSTVKNLTKEDIKDLINISLGPTRFKCVLLSLKALHKGIEQLKQ